MRIRERQIVLGVLLLLTAAYQAGNIYARYDYFEHGSERVVSPFSALLSSMTVNDLTTATRDAGVRLGDQVVALNGGPYLENKRKLLAEGHPGDVARLSISRKGADGQTEEKTIDVTLEAQRSSGPITADEWISSLVEFGVPLFSTVLGFLVVFMRIGDFRAWLLLGVMLSLSVALFTESASSPFDGIPALVWVAYQTVMIGLWPLSMLLFGLYFPSRVVFDIRWPWAKYIFLVPLTFHVAIKLLLNLGTAAGMAMAGQLAQVYAPVGNALFILAIAAVSTFFMNMGFRFRHPGNPDDLRRLTLLFAGTVGSMMPPFIALLLRIAGFGRPAFINALAAFTMPFFPVTLAYVIVVERAMDLGVVIRQGVQYAFAKTGVRILQALITIGVIFAAVRLGSSPTAGRWTQVFLITMGLLAVGLIQKVAERLKNWTDRRFFREAYNAELILGDLADKVRTIVETNKLLETVASRIAESLHVQQIAFLIGNDGVYQPAFAVGYNEVPAAAFAVRSGTVKHLQNFREPVRLYLDDRNSWIYRTTEIDAQELRMLETLNTQLLLPLSLKEKLAGFISLGPKQSEAPFSSSDVRLLKSVAVQTTLALENSQLTAAIASEVSQRERMNRELEIAREVQERLFPQSAPEIAGLDLAGGCRPAMSVGGDYYDFFSMPDGQLGIAVGDISGKGVGAALLMASLQACLRVQTVESGHSLSDVMRNINQVIHETSPSNRYATFFYAQFDSKTRDLKYINGGHNPPVILRGDDVIRLAVGGAVVGLVPGLTYEEGSLTLMPGDVFIAFTDGVSESMNSEDEEWGEDRMVAAAQLCRNTSAKEIIRQLMIDADAFAAGAPQHDDMTLVVARVL